MDVDCRNPEEQEAELEEEAAEDDDDDDEGGRGRPPPSRCIQHCIQDLVKKLTTGENPQIDVSTQAGLTR